MTLLKEYMLSRSEKFAYVLFCIEGYGFLFLVILMYVFVPGGELVYLVSMVVFYGAFNMQQYFSWQKKIADANYMTWIPSFTAKLALLVVSVGALFFGIFLFKISISEFELSFVYSMLFITCFGFIAYGITHIYIFLTKGFNSLKY